LERMRTRPGTAAVLTEQLDAPGFHFLPAFLNASEADHILGAVKRLDTSAWVNSPGVAKRGTALRAELLLSSDSLLPIVLKRFQSYLALVLGRAVDVSAVTKLHVMRYVGNKPAEGLHRDSSVYYEMEGRPLHHMTTMLHLTGQAPSVPAEEAGATYFPDVGPGPGVLVPPSKGALLAFDESVPHAVGHKAPTISSDHEVPPTTTSYPCFSLLVTHERRPLRASASRSSCPPPRQTPSRARCTPK